MKTDREFLDGVYEKAERLRGMDAVSKKAVPIRQKRRVLWRGAVSAAGLCLLLAGGLFFSENQPKMEIPEGYTNMMEKIPMELNGIEPRAIVEVDPVTEADLIAAGKVSAIGKSVYEQENQTILTMVTVTLTERYKGDAATDEVNVAVTGGINEEDHTYLDYEAVFRRGENVLLFLTERQDGSYILFGGAQGKLTRLKGKGREASYAYPDGTEVRLDQLLPEKSGGV